MAKQRRNGVVVGNKMNKTVIVEVQRKASHPMYKKVLTLKKKYYAHSEDELEIGESVVIEQVKPISKTKRWLVVERENSKSKSKTKKK